LFLFIDAARGLPSRLLKNYSPSTAGVFRKGRRAADEQHSQVISYFSQEARVRKDHPLWAIRDIVDEVLALMSESFAAM